MVHELLTALIALGVITLLPGPDSAVVTHAALSEGRAAARQAAAGIATGVVIWGAATVAGLAALLAESAAAYGVVRVVGAAYLVFLGLRTFWRLRRSGEPEAPESDADRRRVGGAFRRGLLSDLLNPKVAVFYVAVLPGLAPAALPPAAGLALLVAMHVLITVMWLVGYGEFVVRAGDAMRRPKIRRRMEATTGGVMVGLGVRIATQSRP